MYHMMIKSWRTLRQWFFFLLLLLEVGRTCKITVERTDKCGTHQEQARAVVGGS